MSKKESGMAEVEISIQEVMDLAEKTFIKNPNIPTEQILTNVITFIGLREINKKLMLKLSADGLTFKRDFWFQEP